MSIRSLSTSTLTSQTRYPLMSANQPSFHETVQYLVVAGGGGSGNDLGTGNTGGGGGGGYRCSVTGESSGGGQPAEVGSFSKQITTFPVVVGAGGSADANGGDSQFGTILSIGGGAGGRHNTAGSRGGSGGGNGDNSQIVDGGAGIWGQGFAGEGDPGAANAGGGAGGGAGEPGGTDAIRYGGDGVQSSITGTSTFRAGGGAGGGAGNLGGDGGGGDDNTAGATNTGGGGGGTGGGLSGKPGGSGIVILKYPARYTLTIGAGLTSSTTTVGDYKVTTFTAGSDDVTIA